MREAYDIVVIGGGLAGVSAALAAARLGSKVALVHDRSVLGGNSSSEVRVGIGGAATFSPWARETGVIEELFLEDRKRNHRPSHNGYIGSLWDLVIYERCRNEKDLTLFLNTSARKASTSTDLGPAACIQEIECVQLGTEKVLRLAGKVFVDASGDGAIAASAGAQFRIGREGKREFNESLAPDEPDNLTQGSSILFHARDMGRPISFEPPSWTAEYPTEDSLLHRRHENIEAGYWWIEIGAPYNTVSDNETIRDELVKHLLGVWDHIKNHGDHGAQNYALDWIGTVPGKRESRRIMGDHILTENDLKARVLFPDRVAYGGWYIDVHTMGAILARDKSPEATFAEDPVSIEDKLVGPYSIPLQCLYSKNIANLLMAGRCISVTHMALGSPRLMATCAVTGQAAGTAAHLCAKLKKTARSIYEDHLSELQQLLLKQDCYIPSVRNEDPEDLIRQSTVSSSSSATLTFGEGKDEEERYPHPMFSFIEREKGFELDCDRAQLFPVTEDRIDRISLLLESRRSEPTRITIDLKGARDLVDFETSKTIATAKARVDARATSWVDFDLNQPIEPHGLYLVHVHGEKDIFWRSNRIAPVGTAAGRLLKDRWVFHKNSYAMRLNPPSMPYGPENLLTGMTRPESWTNIWISDPGEKFPQSVTFDFGQEKTFNTVYLFFDTNLNWAHKHLPPLSTRPECIRDYAVFAREGKLWKRLVRMQGNYQRLRVHRFSSTTSSKLKVEVLATNGAPSAHIYEVRCYDE